MRVQIALLAGLVLLVVAALGIFSLSQRAVIAATVDVERHYRTELTLGAVDIAQMIQTAQDEGFWIRIQTNTDVTYFNGAEPCSACSTSQESLFLQRPSLYVDGNLFRIRLEEEDYELSLRPRTSPMPQAYELIVSPILPKTELDAEDIAELDAALLPFGVLPMPVSMLTLTEIIQTTKVTPPEGAKIDSVLYAITAAPDWNAYASEKNISLSGLRVRVLIELENEDVEFPPSLDILVESQSTNFVRAQVLVNKLLELSMLEGVTFVRLPSTPQPPAAN